MSSEEQSGTSEPCPVEILVEEADVGTRLDVFVAARFNTHSRVQIRRAINAATITIGGSRAKAARRLRLGDQISVYLPPLAREGPLAEDIPLDILYEDEHLAAINKPPAMVVHPSKGHWSGTLAAGLQFHFDQLSTTAGPTRPGIVHRLDRDTSGVIVVAKTDQAHLHLASQFEQRTTEKQYFAIVVGSFAVDRDVIQHPIGPHPYQREKMAIRKDHPKARDAETFYEVAERFAGFATIDVTPKTGRTHQIRVHLASIGCPVICDRLYGGHASISRGYLQGTDDDELLLARQGLHARRLKLRHPATNEPITFEAPLPQDLLAMVEALREYRPLKSGKSRH